MFTLILTVLFLALFGRNMPCYATYTILFCACLAAWLGSGLPIWIVTLAALACWCIVETVLTKVAAREFKLLWQVGNFRLAMAMG